MTISPLEFKSRASLVNYFQSLKRNASTLTGRSHRLNLSSSRAEKFISYSPPNSPRVEDTLSNLLASITCLFKYIQESKSCSPIWSMEAHCGRAKRSPNMQKASL